MSSKYRESFLTNPRSPSNKFSYLLNNIAQVSNHSTLNLFTEADFKWQTGNGCYIRFWLNHWHPLEILATVLNRLYSLFVNKSIMVKEMTSNRNSLRETQITCWRRRLRGWELGDLEELDALVGGVKLSNTKDQLLWKVRGK